MVQRFRIYCLLPVLIVAVIATAAQAAPPFEETGWIDMTPPGSLSGALADSIEFYGRSGMFFADFYSSDVFGNDVIGLFMVAALGDGIWIVNISNAASPAKVAELYLEGGDNVRVQGNYAFVGTDHYGLKVVEISSPAAPVLVATYPYTYEHPDVNVMEIDGSYAYLGHDEATVEIVDISNPLAPAYVSLHHTSLPGFSRVKDLAINGSYLYVADNGGFEIVDLSNPYTPALVAEYNSPTYVFQVEVVGSYAYLGEYSQIEILDISTPTSPTPVYTYPLPKLSEKMAVADNYLYVDQVYPTLQILILDITNPVLPTLASTYSGYHNILHELRFYGSTGRICSTSDMQLLTVGTTFPGDLDLAASIYCYKPWNVTVAGDVTYVSRLNRGLEIVDVSDASHPSVIDNYYTGAWVFDVALVGTLAYLATDDGITILDVTDPSSPLPLGSASAGTYIHQAVAVQGSFAYTAANLDGLMIFDVSDPSNPFLVGSYNTPGTAYDVQVRGQYAYVADNGSLRILDISDPAAPTPVGSHTAAYCTSVALYGDYALSSTEAPALHILDISDPAAPVDVATYVTTGETKDIFMTGDTAWVSDGSGGVVVLDMSDPINPVRLTSSIRPSALNHLFFDGNYVYAAEDGGFEIVEALLPSCCVGIRGDVDGSGVTNVSDLTYLVNHLFKGGPAPACFEEGDVDGSGDIKVSDLTYLVNHLFRGGPDPVPC